MRRLLIFFLCVGCFYSRANQLRADDAFLKEIRKDLQESEKATRQIKDNTQRFVLLREIATAYGKSGFQLHSGKLFEEYIRDEEKGVWKGWKQLEFNGQEPVLSRTVKSGNAIAASRTVKRYVKKERERSVLLRRIVSIACYSGQIDEAIEITRSVPLGDRDQNYFTIAVALASEGRFENALEIVNRIREESTRESVWFEIAAKCVNKGKYRLAKILIGKTSEKVESKNTKHLVKISIAFVRKERFREALKIAEKIPKTNDEFDSLSIYDLATEFLKKKKYQEALKVANSISDSWTRFEILSEIANSQLESGKHKAARETFRFLAQTIKRLPVKDDQGDVTFTYVGIQS